MDSILKEYYENNGRKLNSVVDKVINRKFGGVQGKDMDSYYSIANEVMADIVGGNRYDKSKGDFEGFLYNALTYAFIDELKEQNRFKRCNKKYVLDKDGNVALDEDGKPKVVIVRDVSLDAPINDMDGITYGDMIQSDFDMDSHIESLFDEIKDEKMIEYLGSLTEIQRQILQMKMDDIPVSEIKSKLNLSGRQYDQNCNVIKSFEKISILGLKTVEINEEEEEQVQNTNIFTLEKSKVSQISTISIIKKMDMCAIRFNHPLQRESDQWTSVMKGNLISDILQNNPLPQLVFAEQVINGVAVIWDLDGKQRCTNVHSFYNNGYRITKNIRRWDIEYQAPVYDEDGNLTFDESQNVVYEKKTFDIRGKRFCDLPEELQDRFKEYTFDYIEYINCSKDDIKYHIIRYNEGKAMTSSQKGITRLGEEYATIVKAISNMPFFKDMGGYKVSEFKNGTISRVVAESVMAANFLEDWKKKQEDMCDYLKDHASITDFENFEDMVTRLEKVVTDDTANMFDSKDSFLWFGLFAKFTKSESDDSRFIEFMTEFAQSLHTKEIDGVSFDSLNGKSTKDKSVVIAKINHLEKLMKEFLCVNDEEIIVEDVCDFVKGIVSDEVTQEDVDLYSECLNDIEVNVDSKSKLLERENLPSLVAITAYAILNDDDQYLEEWLPVYITAHSDYIRNQRENFITMKCDFDQYVSEKEIKTA